MNEENQYAQLLLSIVAYTKGRWCIDDVVAFYEYILEEMQEQERPDLKIVALEFSDDGSRD
jgi:hypothetical protein